MVSPLKCGARLALWGVWIGVPGLALLYGISATGQKLSAYQMEELRQRIDELVEGLEA